MPTELLGVLAGEDLLKHLVVLGSAIVQELNPIHSSADCTFPGEATAVVCLLSPTQWAVLLVKVY